MFTRFHLGDDIVDPLKLTAEKFKPAVVADALAHINRYNGNGLFKISVAQHSFILSRHVPVHLRMAALTHDIPEVFTGDINGPLLAMLGPKIISFQNEVLRNLANILQIDYTLYMELSPFDKRISTDEREAIFPCHSGWKNENTVKGLGATFSPIEPDYAKKQWLAEFYDCIALQQQEDTAVAGADVS